MHPRLGDSTRPALGDGGGLLRAADGYPRSVRRAGGLKVLVRFGDRGYAPAAGGQRGARGGCEPRMNIRGRWGMRGACERRQTSATAGMHPRLGDSARPALGDGRAADGYPRPVRRAGGLRALARFSDRGYAPAAGGQRGARAGGWWRAVASRGWISAVGRVRGGPEGAGALGRPRVCTRGWGTARGPRLGDGGGLLRAADRCPRSVRRAGGLRVLARFGGRGYAPAAGGLRRRTARRGWASGVRLIRRFACGSAVGFRVIRSCGSGRRGRPGWGR
jgi:hypothetical protein